MPWLYRNITAASTVNISQGPADLIAVVVNTAAAASTVQILDTNSPSPSTSTAQSVGKVDSSATGNFFYGNICRNGIAAVVAGGNPDVTIIFDQYGTEDVRPDSPEPPYGY
jgi:hypothetical protein